MNVSLLLVDRDKLASLAADSSVLGDMSISSSSLPPPFLMELAARRMSDGMNPVWGSFYLFVSEELRLVVGAGGYKGPPCAGRVEVGYNVGTAFQGRGIATLAVGKLVETGFTLPEVTEIFAETSVANAASRRVVEKAGFRRIGSRMSEDDGEVDQWLFSR